MKDQIIREIKKEIHRLEVSNHQEEFDKHLYTVETLVALLKSDVTSTFSPGDSHLHTVDESEKVSDEALKMMGAKMSTKKEPSQLSSHSKTEDGVGNGDSIFDF